MSLRGVTSRSLATALGLALVWLLSIGLDAGMARAVEDDDRIFTVNELPIDQDAESANIARGLAIADGQRRAMQRILERMVLRADHEFVRILTDDEIAAFVQAISITNERTSSTRYLANLTVRFKKDSIRRFLQDQGIGYAETVSKPRLLLPVYEAAGAQLLWDDPNPWRSAWETRDADDGSPVPLILPRGDRGDIFAIGAAQVVRGDAERLSAIAGRYGLSDVLIAHATLEIDLAANVPRLNVTLREVGPAGGAVIVQSFRGVARDRVPELLVQAVAEATFRLEEDWKRDNILQFDNPVRLSVRVPISELEDWVEVRDRLAASAVVRQVELAALSQTDAQVVLHYLGEPGQLALDLRQRDLDLSQVDGFWTLALSKGLGR